MTPPSTYPDVIRHYALPNPDLTLKLPVGAQILFVNVYHHMPRIWVRHTTDRTAPRKRRRFRIVGAGNPVPAATTYLGTFFAGAYVYHVLEVTA